MVTPVYKLTNPYGFNHWQWCKQIIVRVCVTHMVVPGGIMVVPNNMVMKCHNIDIFYKMFWHVTWGTLAKISECRWWEYVSTHSVHSYICTRQAFDCIKGDWLQVSVLNKTKRLWYISRYLSFYSSIVCVHLIKLEQFFRWKKSDLPNTLS